VAVELNGLLPGRGPGRGAPREPGLGDPDRGGPDGAPPGRGPAGLGAGAGAVRGADPAVCDVSSMGTIGTGACGPGAPAPVPVPAGAAGTGPAGTGLDGAGLAGAGPAGAGPAGTGPAGTGPTAAGRRPAVRSAAAAGPVACGLMSCCPALAAGAGACGRAGPGRGALRPPFCPSTAPPPGTAPAATAPAGVPSDGPDAGLGFRDWAFGAWAENASLSLRTTGASIVDDAERTNSPISWSLAITALLSTPNSFASSYTRTFATALPLVGPAHPDHRGRSGAARAPAGVSFWCSSPRSHRALITTDPAFPAVLPFPPQPRPLSLGQAREGPWPAPPGTPRACQYRTVPAGAAPAETPFGAALARSIPGGDAGTRPGRAAALEGRERCRPLPPPSAASQTWPHGPCSLCMCGSQARPAHAARTVWSLSKPAYLAGAPAAPCPAPAAPATAGRVVRGANRGLLLGAKPRPLRRCQPRPARRPRRPRCPA
jgi:hypothetical protein